MLRTPKLGGPGAMFMPRCVFCLELGFGFFSSWALPASSRALLGGLGPVRLPLRQPARGHSLVFILHFS